MSGCIFLEFLKSLGTDDSALFLSGDRVLGLKYTEISDHNEEIQLPLLLSFPHLPSPLPCVCVFRLLELQGKGTQILSEC